VACGRVSVGGELNGFAFEAAVDRLSTDCLFHDDLGCARYSSCTVIYSPYPVSQWIGIMFVVRGCLELDAS
jgi:hypothetical protein